MIGRMSHWNYLFDEETMRGLAGHSPAINIIYNKTRLQSKGAFLFLLFTKYRTPSELLLQLVPH